MDGFEEGTTKRNASSIEVCGVSFRADKNLIKDIDRNCDLERGGEERLKISKFSLEERIKRARQFLQKNRYMRVNEYAAITGLAYTTASRELRRIAHDPASGIISQGRKSAKLYLLAEELSGANQFFSNSNRCWIRALNLAFWASETNEASMQENHLDVRGAKRSRILLAT